MNDFQMFFSLGWEHIMTTEAADHLLFIAVLIASYQINEWRKVLVLVTAFTIGHSFSLGFSAYGLWKTETKLIEFLIPLTITCTSIFQFVQLKYEFGKLNAIYLTTVFFGLIHGLGFASAISLLNTNSDESILIPLLGFNIGIEVAQISIVMIFLLISWLSFRAGLSKQFRTIIIALITLIFSLYMCVQRWPW